MEAYPQPLRQRILDAYDRGDGSVRQLAQLFDVSPTTVQKYLNRRNRDGEVTPIVQTVRGPAPSIDDKGLKVLAAIVRAQNDRTIDEYADLYAQKTGVRVCHTVMVKALKRAGLGRKKRASSPASSTAPK